VPVGRDLTKGPEWQQLLGFAFPMMGAQLLQVTYSMVDAIILGNFVSATALGAASVPGPIIWVASSIASGMGTGTNIIAAQYMGAEKEDEVRSAAATSVLFCGLLGVLLSALCALLSGPIIHSFLQTPIEMEPEATVYLAVYSVGFLFQLLYQVFYGITRAFGDSKASLIFLMVAAVLNLVLDLGFIILLDLGVAGAALASVIAQAGSAIAAFLYLVIKYPIVSPALRQLRLDRRQLALIIKVSLPVTFQMVVQSAGFLLLQRMVNSFGTASIEGFAAMGKTEELMHIPIICVSTALTSFVGQNMGARRVDRAERGIRFALYGMLALSVALGGIMLLCDRYILHLFNITGESMLRGKEHMDVMCLLLPVFTVGRVLNGALQGAGDVHIPVISSFTDLILRLVLTALLSLTPVSFRAVYLSTPPAWIISCLITVIRFRQGRWKYIQIIP